jgi:hypothetical protein
VQVKRKSQVRSGLPATRTVQRVPSQSAATARWAYRTLSSTPCSRAVARTYSRIEAPSASVLSPGHGRNE